MSVLNKINDVVSALANKIKEINSGSSNITPGSGSSNSNVPVSSTAGIYSTDETEIGTWIDNTPLYRKVVLSTLNSYDSDDEPSKKIHGTIANVATVVDLETFTEVSDADGGGLSGNVFIDTENNLYITCSKDNQNSLTIETVQAGTIFDDAPIRFLVMYTKAPIVESTGGTGGTGGTSGTGGIGE